MSDLKFRIDADVSVPDTARSIRNEGDNMIGKFLNELLSEMSPPEFAAMITKWVESPVAEMMAHSFLLERSILQEQIEKIKNV